MDADSWSTLPDDLLVDIFRHLNVTAVIRCAGACRPWRRAIVDNASCFRPRPDRFFPDLPLGFLESQLDRERHHLPRKLQYVPASNSTVPFLVPATGVCVDGRLYSDLLSSRDGFLLLGEHIGTCDSLCLFTGYTGNCRVLPAAEFDNCSLRRSMYVLATRYDVVNDCSTSDDGDEKAVWILAVDRQRSAMDGSITYQIFSTTSGAWGPVKCSAKFPEEDVIAQLFSTQSGSVVVCDAARNWLVYVARNTRIRKCLFSFDLRTERTRITELPCVLDTGETPSFVLAVSEDGRLCLVKMLRCSYQMVVWVLVGDGQWTLRRTIDEVQKLLPDCSSRWVIQRLSGFCPRSGYLFGTGSDDMGFQHHFLIGVDGSSPRLIERVESRSSASWFPYEMDWSTYISSYIPNMKYF